MQIQQLKCLSLCFCSELVINFADSTNKQHTVKQFTAEISQLGPSGSTDVAETNVADPPPTKKRKLFANYGSRTSNKDSLLLMFWRRTLQMDQNRTATVSLSGTPIKNCMGNLFLQCWGPSLFRRRVPPWSACSATGEFFWSPTVPGCLINYCRR